MNILIASLLLLGVERNVYVVTDYGVTGDGITINDRQLGNVLRLIPQGKHATIYFPSGTYLFAKPIFLDKHFIKIKGHSQETTIIKNTDYGQLMYLSGTYPYKSHRIPGPGIKLDDHFIMVQSFPPATGANDYWANTNALTINLKVEFISGDGDILGLGDREAPSPFSIRRYFEPGLGYETIEVNFRTQSRVENGADSPRTFSFGNLDKYPGIKDICFQMDFSKGDDLIDISAWINNDRQAIIRGFGTRFWEPTGTEPSFSPKDGLKFRRNKIDNFHIANNRHTDSSWQRPVSQRPVMNLYGLYIGTGTDFKGDKLQRIDNGPVTDDYKFSGVGRNPEKLIARLWLEQPDEGDRIVRFITGTKSGNTNIMGLMVSEQVSRVDGCSIEDITLQTPFWGGAALSLGQFMNFSIKNCSLIGGNHGIISQWAGASYDGLISDSTVYGRDCWMYLNSSIFDIKRLGRTYVDGSALRFVGCDIQLDTLRTGSNGQLPTIDCLIGSDYASTYNIRYVNIDEEGTNAQPVIRVEKMPGGTSIYASDLAVGYQNGSVPFFELVDFFPSSGYNGSYQLERISGNKQFSFTKIAPTWTKGWYEYPNTPRIDAERKSINTGKRRRLAR